ncbi:SDR family oxidoreductase [Terriglobus tenax]|uniref:SDR family oxidoreductase n=1 Tax=Terriglobus tenax TaxID=1111115 RepID=UPI0021DFE019|nr:SDR family oxidoreductase [Terriglobus tenax]
MKIVVIGGTGLIGKKLVKLLEQAGHTAVAASPSSGVNAYTGEGLADVLRGAEVVVELTNPTSFDPAVVMDFFTKSAANLIPAEKAAGVKHHVVLSVVGAERQAGSGYMPGKVAQEEAVKASGIPYTIVRATQFFEFLGSIADFSTKDGFVTVSSVKMQPMAADDVAAAVAKATLGIPLHATVDVAGPEKAGIDALVRRVLAAKKDPRVVVTDDSVGYFGATVDDHSLVPIGETWLGEIRLEDWLKG